MRNRGWAGRSRPLSACRPPMRFDFRTILCVLKALTVESKIALEYTYSEGMTHILIRVLQRVITPRNNNALGCSTVDCTVAL
jgi:hypothetical protein